MAKERAQWGSRLGFILAASGSAVGLGNVWKFPYITGENGGGLFVLIYLACIALVGLPIMMAEIMIGRAAQRQTVAAFHELSGKHSPWAGVGWMGALAGFVILSYYVVVAGWAMDYTLKSVVNFSGSIHDDAEIEAMEYRASADLDGMRLTLVERRAATDGKDAIERIRREGPPSAWKAMANFESARTKALADGATTEAEAEERLLSREGLREDVELARVLQVRMKEAATDARLAAEAHYAAFTDIQIRDEAETVERRRIIYEKIDGVFGELATDGWTSLFWATLFMSITIAIVARGISKGIERACRILMPTLIGLMLVMVFYGMTKSGFGEAVAFVFKPDPTKLKASGVLEALGHAFFTLSLGMGAMITYGSYQRTKTGLATQAIWITVLDTGIALLACLMIFPIIFTYGQEPAAGPGLVFKSMPLAFSEIGRGGMLLAIVFFGLLVFAALTSGISLLEVVASYFIDEQNWSRPKAALVIGGVILLFGVASSFAFDPDFILGSWASGYGMSFFDTIDYLASNWMLPLGGLFISIYAGWILPKRFRDAELEDVSPLVVTGWLVLVRFIAPALVIVVLFQKVGILDADELFYRLFG